MTQASLTGSSTGLVQPHGGTLKQLMGCSHRVEELRREARRLPTWDLSERQVCDVELLLSGGYSPLDGFMTEANYASVCRDR